MGIESSSRESNDTPSDTIAQPLDCDAATSRHAGLALGPGTGLLLALAAGVLCWGLGEAFFPVFTPPERLTNAPPSAEEQRGLEMAANQAGIRNVMLFVGILGALVGGSLAVGEGILRRSGRAVLAALVLGTTVAAVFGCLAGLAGQTAFDFDRSNEAFSPLAKTIRTQTTMLAILGIGIGLAVGFHSGRRRIALTCIAGGLLSGVLAGIVYPTLTAICFPTITTESLLPPQAKGRLLWIVVLTCLTGLIIPGVGRQKNLKRARQSPADPGSDAIGSTNV